jgi:hypothetical protein
VVENALQQTERVCAMMKQIAGTDEGLVVTPGRNGGRETRAGNDAARMPVVMFSSAAGDKPLTRRERAALNLIGEGCSSKEGALRMRIPAMPDDLSLGASSEGLPRICIAGWAPVR